MSETRDSWCIVALPSEDDLTYQVSSEKVPHMTLLFLGEQTDSDLAISIIETLRHTVNQVFPHKFGMMVDRRGELGEDRADVLFFENFGNKSVHNFRNMLLKDDNIKRCYDSVEQYPQWTPHLTLGYPDKPAKSLPKDHGPIGYVHFDRIALWIGDSEGPEVRLGQNDNLQAVPISEDAYHTDRFSQNVSNRTVYKERPSMMIDEDVDVDDFLAHYGVKGMKWGKRKQRQADTLRRVGSGKSSTADKVRAVGGMSTMDVMRGGGSIKKAATKKADRIQGKIDKNDAKRDARDATREKASAARADAKTKRTFTGGKKIAADVVLTGGLVTARDMAKSAGYSSGKATAIAVVGGVPGAMIASELKFRR